MVRTDILEGLRAALIRGESLKQAMQSFYNAGYKKEDIEKAARALYGYQRAIQQTAQLQPAPQQPLQPIQQRIPTKSLPITQYQPQQQYIQRPPPQQQITQKVSAYETQEKPKRNIALIIILSTILVLLIGALVGLIIFREQAINFITKLIG